MTPFRFLFSCLLGASLLLSPACSGVSGGREDGGDPGEDEKPGLENGLISEEMRQELSDYFLDVIGNGYREPDSEGAIASADIETNADMVWEAWKTANDSFTEQKLIATAPLAEEKYGRWNLPEELEPSALMRYYYGSKGDMPEDGWPLYLYLHGSGDRETEWSTGLFLCGEFDDAPSLYFIPQIPNEGDWYRWWQQSKQFAWEKLLRLALAGGEVDPDRIYVFGISEGGYGSQRLASFYADYLAAAGPMAGGEPLKNAPAENCANLAFSLRTGANDTGFFRNELTQYTLDEFDRLESLHPGLYKHWIELIPGSGHSIDYYPTTPWLSEYTRNPWPKYFCWENFEMDGRRRAGFHNIQVLEDPAADMSQRTVYEMDIEGNTVDISVRTVSYETVESRDGIDMKFSKNYSDAVSGSFRVYLNEELVKLGEELTITVNGETAFKGVLSPDVKAMAASCALFGDPRRIFPCAVDIVL